MANGAIGNLCKACEGIFKDSSELGQLQRIHHGLDALRARAGRGCQLCLTVYMSMNPSALIKFQKSSPASDGFVSLSHVDNHQIKLTFTYGDIESRASSSSGLKSQASAIDLNAPRSRLSLSVDLLLVKQACKNRGLSYRRFADVSTR